MRFAVVALVLFTAGGAFGAEFPPPVEGDFTIKDFKFTSGAGDTIEITDPFGSIAGGAVTTLASAANNSPSPAGFTGGGNVALLGSYMASLFASPEGQLGTPMSATTQALHSLAAPHHA